MLRVLLEVEVCAVGYALHLAPSPGEEVLDVRGGLGIVGEFSGLVDAQSQVLLTDTVA